MADESNSSPEEVSAGSTVNSSPENAGVTFGSQKILGSCWTAQELKGSSKDKRITKDPGGLSPPQVEFYQITLPPVPKEQSNSIRSINPAKGEKVLALTFDLCERADEITGYDAAIVNYLRANNIKATFFASGKWMANHKEKIMQLMADPLFEIGNHAWTHDDLRIDQGIKLEDQVLWTQIEYGLIWEELKSRPCVQGLDPLEMENIPRLPLLFRFPYGVCSKAALDYLAQTGLPAVQWSIVTGDPDPNQTAQGIAQEVLRKAKPGAIIICHANGLGHGTAQALALFIPRLKKSGYEFVTVSELLACGPAFSTEDCYELKPGDNYRYDKIYGNKSK